MIKSIFAVDHWGGMGLNGTLAWPHNSEDLKYFKSMTEGQVVVMGRRTWDDPKMPKPLPGRTTYVVSNRQLDHIGAYTIRGNLVDRIQKIQESHPKKTIWIIGGPAILMETKDIVDEARITHFKGQYKTDVQIDLREYLKMFRFIGVKPGLDRSLSWVTYKNIDIFKPL
jgi:dihydrofolate reductase